MMCNKCYDKSVQFQSAGSITSFKPCDCIPIDERIKLSDERIKRTRERMRGVKKHDE